jgi:ComF family protein
MPLPSECLICHQWPGAALCDNCIEHFAQPRPRCRRCALPNLSDCCAACQAAPPVWDDCLCAVDYGYPWQACVSRLKFQGELGLAHSLGRLMRHAPWVEPALEQATFLLPMPLSPERLQHRGYNQALLLARAIGRGCTLPIPINWLQKWRDTVAQSELSRTERLENVAGSLVLSPRHRHRLRGARVVLVDDVMTTGASLDAASRVLRHAGVSHITTLVLARTEAPATPAAQKS